MAKTFQFDYPTPELVKEYVDKFDNDKALLSNCLKNSRTTQNSMKC